MERFSLSKLTCDDFVEMLQYIASLVEDLLCDDCKCVLMTRFLNDLFELRCLKKRKTRGKGFCSVYER